MRWINHFIIAGGLCAVANPVAVPAALLGGTAPDWLEKISPMFAGRKLKHRHETHYVAYWLMGIGFFLFLWDWNNYGFWFTVGGLSHVLADACTVSGVPLGWWSDRRFHLFGGRLRTGGSGEYAYSIGFAMMCISASLMLTPTARNFMPFFYDWGEHYESGLIDAKEWRENRLKLI